MCVICMYILEWWNKILDRQFLRLVSNCRTLKTLYDLSLWMENSHFGIHLYYSSQLRKWIMNTSIHYNKDYVLTLKTFLLIENTLDGTLTRTVNRTFHGGGFIRVPHQEAIIELAHLHTVSVHAVQCTLYTCFKANGFTYALI